MFYFSAGKVLDLYLLIVTNIFGHSLCNLFRNQNWEVRERKREFHTTKPRICVLKSEPMNSTTTEAKLL